MKRIRIFLATAVAATSFVSCNFLETNPTGWYGEDVVYSSVDHLDLYVRGLYGILYANSDIAAGYVFDDACTDLVKESWYGTGGGAVNKMFLDGTGITPESNFRSNWGNYTYIRRLNEYFHDLNYGYIDGLPADIVKVRTAEVRFLRAFAYQELTLRHGGVILRIDEKKVDGPEENAKARSSEEECWNFVISEYEKAAADLPLSWEGNDRGRITKGAAIGMKARALLYARRWADAAAACDEVFNLNQYELVPGKTPEAYNGIFNQPYNKELILPVYYATASSVGSKQHNFNNYFCPPGDGTAFKVQVGAAATPTDEYASAFDIKLDDKYQAFSWDKLEQYGNKPFDNREPRFYANILYNGASWRGRTLELFEGGQDGFMSYKNSGQDNVHKSTTGYIFRKFLSDASNMNYVSILSGQYWIEMRLAEIYLIRSEANARQGLFIPAYADLNEIRDRVGMEKLPVKASWDDYLKDLMKERVCELGMEGHRFFDLVRWGKAQDVLDGKYAHGIKITKKSDGSFNYEYIACDPTPRQFPERFNIFPIPYSELKANKLCEQNSVWL